jgi:hypothetical protein
MWRFGAVSRYDAPEHVVVIGEDSVHRGVMRRLADVMRHRVPPVLVVLLALGASACSDTTFEVERTDPTRTSTTEMRVSDGSSSALGVIELESNTEPTDAAEREAMQLRRRVIDHIERIGWTGSTGAAAAGYSPMAGDEAHWVNRAFVTDGQTFDPSAPEFLVLDGDKVVGTMFLAGEPGLTAPDPPGAPFIRWHYHRFGRTECLEDGLVVVASPVDGRCAAGADATDVSPLMAHIWIIDMDDPFTADMAAHRQH